MRFAAQTLLVATALSSAAALAQTAPAPVADDQQIVVTGSRLKRALSDTVEPTFILSSQQIEMRGYTNVGDALRELPEFGPGINGVGGQSGFGPGQTFVDFFGLGTQRTLTLVNGRRVVPNNTSSVFGPTGGGGSQVDLNTIPTNLVDRIETIAVGGAPIYGSDAIAGTVNIILKKNYKGFTIDGQTGVSERGDAGNYRLRALAGTDFAGGRGNITGSFEYNKSDGLIGTDRAIIARQLSFTTALPGSPYQQVLINNRTIPALSEQGIPFILDTFARSPAQQTGRGYNPAVGYSPTVNDANGNPLRFNTGGGLIPINFGTATGNSINFSGGNGLDLGPVTNLLTPTERYLGSVLASYQVTDHIRAFGEAWYNETDGTNLVDQGYYNTALFAGAGQINGNFIIPLSNPFLSPAARATIANDIATYAAYTNNPANNVPAGRIISPNQNFFYLGRSNEDLEPSTAIGNLQTYRFVAGLNGDFSAAGRDLNWEIVGNYGHSSAIDRSPQVVNANLYNAINATTDAAGNIVCAPGYTNATIATLSPTCAPLNLFGRGSVSKAALNYITAIAKSTSTNEQVDVTATISGDVFKLPAGGVGLVLGYEHRDERARFDPGAFYLGELQADGTYNQYGNSIPITPVNGGFYTNEGFAELRLPVVNRAMGLRFIDTFELEAAARYVRHSISGGDFTWTGGGRLGFIRDVTFTGNFTRAIRAPAITEAFSPVGQSFSTANDPCDSRFIGSGPNPANRAKNCAAAGVVQPFGSNIVDFTVPSSVGGNRNLTNEISDSWTVGAQINPRFIPRLAINVSWVNIDLKNAIVTLTAEQVLNACYDASSFPSAVCGNINRGADGQVNFIKTGYENAAELKYAGLLASAAYTIPTPRFGETGKVSFNGQYQYIDTLQQRVGTGDQDIFVNSLRGISGGGNNRHKATVSANYNSDFLGLQLQAQYFSSAVFNANDAINAKNIPAVNDVVFLNAAVLMNVNKHFTLRFNVDNLLDQAPPYPSTAGDTQTYFTGILGRYFTAAATVKF